MGTDGSLRIVEIALACDIEFVGAVDEALGRPTTNIEALIADPTNNVTPNQAQTDLLNEELAIYWRIAERLGNRPRSDGTGRGRADDCRHRVVGAGGNGDDEPADVAPTSSGAECRRGRRFSRLAACSTCRAARSSSS